MRMAARLRKDATMSLNWIAHRSEMGSGRRASRLFVVKIRRKSLKSEN